MNKIKRFHVFSVIRLEGEVDFFIRKFFGDFIFLFPELVLQKVLQRDF